MNENNDNKPVTQNDFKSELKSLRLEFKEALFDLHKGIQEQIHSLQEQMKPLAHLDTIIFRNTLKVMLAVGLP